LKRNFLSLTKGNGLKARLIKGAGGLAVLKVINVFLMLSSGVLLARVMGPEHYGVYAFVLSIVTLLILPAKAGLPTLLVRETAYNQLKGNWGLLRGLIKLSGRFVLGYSIFIVIVAWIYAHYGWEGSNTVRNEAFLWALLLVPFLAYTGIRTGALRGLRWVVSSEMPEQLIRPIIVLICAGLLLLIGRKIDAVTAVQINIIAAIVAFLIGTIVLFKALPAPVKHIPPEYTLRPWLASLFPLSIFVGLKLLDSQVSLILLGVFGSSEEVGLFKVATTGAGLVAFGMTAVNMAMSPHLARLFHEGNMETLQRMIIVSTRLVALTSFPVAVAFIFWGETIISFIFGPEYSGAGVALAILCIGQLVNASAGPVATLLNMAGKDRVTVLVSMIALGVNIALGVTLIPLYGITGAALSFAVSVSSWNIILMFVAKKQLGINTYLGALTGNRSS
jgi:O-antigen/teichoic acid export membrane protein